MNRVRPGARLRDQALAHADQVWDRVAHLRVVGFLARAVSVFVSIEARDRILMLAGQGFIALMPLLIIVASVTTSTGSDRVGERIIDRMGLTDSAADGVRVLFAHPPDAAGGVTLFSALLLLFSLNGFARSVQRTFEEAWTLPRMGARAAVSRTVGVFILLGAGFFAGWVGRLLDGGPAVYIFGVAAQFAVIVLAWMVGTGLMVSRRLPFRSLTIGAVLSTAIQLVAGWGTALYLPDLFERNAERYGVIGVALALVAWLIAVASVIVGGAIVGAVLGTPADSPAVAPWRMRSA